MTLEDAAVLQGHRAHVYSHIAHRCESEQAVPYRINRIRKNELLTLGNKFSRLKIDFLASSGPQKKLNNLNFNISLWIRSHATDSQAPRRRSVLI